MNTYHPSDVGYIPPDAVREGYDFVGWSPEAIPVGAREDIKFTAQWSPVSYSITYDLNGGSVSDQKTNYTIETAAFTLPTPTKTGYTFTGWTGTGLVGGNGTSYSASYTDATYARIDTSSQKGYLTSGTSAASVSMMLDANGGTFEDGSSVLELNNNGNTD